MATTRQILANRRNALKGTGPNSPAGKDIVSRNAVTHGLSAQKHLLTTFDDPEELERFSQRLWLDLDPVGQVEIILAERILAAAWRLRRLVRIESEILERGFEKSKSLLPLHEKYDPHTTPPSLGSSVAENINSVDTYGKLSWHEAALERSLHRNLNQLQKFRSQRLEFSGEVTTLLLVRLAQDPPDR